ncbi:F-box/LRR-repeat protein 20, partial [Neolecta irregularis DAH-3]
RSRKDWTAIIPKTVLLQIFSYVHRRELISLSRVCKTWREMTYDGSLWKSFVIADFSDSNSHLLNLKPGYSYVPGHEVMRILKSAGSFIRHLNLRGCNNLLPREFASLGIYCTNLISLNLDGCYIAPESLPKILKVNNSLHHLDVSGVPGIPFSSFTLLSRKFLQTLDISWCPTTRQLTNGVIHVLENCPGLIELRMNEFGEMHNPDILIGIHNLSRLESLHLAECPRLSDTHMKLLIRGPSYPYLGDMSRLLSLRHLNLSQCLLLSDATLIVLANQVPELSRLEFTGCNNLTDVGFKTLLRTIPKLTHLDLEDVVQITDETILSLSAYNPNLRHLQLSYCIEVTDHGIIHLLRSCQYLISLEIDNTELSDVILLHLSSQMRLVVYDCPRITWAGIREVMISNSERKGGWIRLKCYYAWQNIFNSHFRACLRGDTEIAKWIERRWAETMMKAEEQRGADNNSRECLVM